VREANAHIFTFVVSSGQLDQAFADIHDLRLPRRGDFATEYMAARGTVQAIARRFAHRGVPNIHFKDAFSYDARPPLSTVLDPYDLHADKAVSAVLRKVTQCIERLKHIENNDKSTQILVFEALSFTRLCYEFQQAQVIFRSSAVFCETSAAPHVIFDRWLVETARHTASIVRGCWVSLSGEDVGSGWKLWTDWPESNSSDHSIGSERHQFSSSLEVVTAKDGCRRATSIISTAVLHPTQSGPDGDQQSSHSQHGRLNQNIQHMCRICLAEIS
jgi:hypothetical protein